MRDLSTSDLNWTAEPDISFDAASVIDRHSAFDGNFRSQRDIRVEGDLKGNVSCDGTLFVADGASVAASVDAEHVTVAGDLNGDIRCRGRLHILPSGRVRAKVATGSLVIQEGAVYEGQLEMAGIEISAPRPIRARARANTDPINLEASAMERTSGPDNGTTFIRRLGSPEAPWESPGGDAEAAIEDESENTDEPAR